MLKTILYSLLVLGFLFSFLYPPLGDAFLGIALIIILVFVFSKNAEVLENWSTLIGGAQGKGDQIIIATEELVASTKAPSVETVEESVGPGLSKTAFGETRKFLICTNKIGLKFRSYKIFINANDYGKNLFVSWYLTHKPDWWETLMLLLPGAKQVLNLENLNLFDRQDLTAYVSNVHHCFLAAVDKLLLELKQDPSKIDRKTKGFLGIS
jgi:hypothetical protein